jgi:hypothetical protein
MNYFYISWKNYLFKLQLHFETYNLRDFVKKVPRGKQILQWFVKSSDNLHYW